MKNKDIIYLFNNLIEGDIHTTIDHILMMDNSYTAEQLLECYDSL